MDIYIKELRECDRHFRKIGILTKIILHIYTKILFARLTFSLWFMEEFCIQLE